MLATGRWAFLDHLKGGRRSGDPVPGGPRIGPELARRVCETFHIDTLEGLEAAAHDGRLEQVPGFGHRRAAMVRAALATMLARVRRNPLARSEEPGVDLLLDVDREYRERAAAGDLIKIAPKRFNPKGEAWLPLLHAVRGSWHFTALYSNTARAHQLRRITDWVIIYFHKDGEPEGRRTVVTETRGEAAGKRVVRGREAECRYHYASIWAALVDRGHSSLAGNPTLGSALRRNIGAKGNAHFDPAHGAVRARKCLRGLKPEEHPGGWHRSAQVVCRQAKIAPEFSRLLRRRPAFDDRRLAI